MLLASLMFAAVVLTCTMFATRNMMLGFPAAMFWAIVGGFAYTQSTAAWDVYYLMFFASMGMTIFSSLAMYALRRRDIEPREADWEDSGDMVDEGGSEPKQDSSPKGDGEPKSGDGEPDDWGQPSPRAKALHDRAAKRRRIYGSHG